jgi:hypothetical protein
MTRYRDLRAAEADRTKKGVIRKKSKALLHFASLVQPPATPARVATGLDASGQSSADNNGGAHWRAHLQGNDPSQREMRRVNRFGRYGTQPMRSRIQRTRRKTRTGGVR